MEEARRVGNGGQAWPLTQDASHGEEVAGQGADAAGNDEGGRPVRRGGLELLSVRPGGRRGGLEARPGAGPVAPTVALSSRPTSSLLPVEPQRGEGPVSV